MKLICDRKIRQYRNTTEWSIDRNKKTKFCCDNLKNSVEAFSVRKYGETPSAQLSLRAGDDYYDGDYCEDKDVSFCPFCGDKIEIELGDTETITTKECPYCRQTFPSDSPYYNNHISDHRKCLEIPTNFSPVEIHTQRELGSKLFDQVMSDYMKKD
jgi:hypothetical protein